MRTAIAKAWHLLVAVVVALAVIVPIQLTVAPAASSALAADASRFDPGNIISDAQFYDGNAMSAGQVQSFLESRVRACDYSRAQLPCLRDYTQSTPTMGATMRCAPYQGALSERASDIIAKVGAACGISQKALLVLLQKEQSLVDDTWPWVSQYEHATGYNCPDTAPCDPAYAGFFYQVYWAAYAFQAYKANGGGPNYKAFRVNTIHWHPNAACGTSQVYIANLATAGLYNYTPYRPNAAALANLYGTGDGCSSYGNRNFWRLWSDWFGSPTASAPIGWMDSATLAKSVLTVTGWAVDPDTPATALQVQLQVNGTVVTTANAAGAKPGLGAAIEGAAPGAGDNHAYSMSTTLGVGTHIVCVVGVDTAGDTNSRLLYGGVDATDNCARIIVSSAPYGWMDSALVSSGTLTVKGWAIDPDTPTTAIEVLLVVDGDVVATRTANGKRPGLGAAVLPAAGDDHGYLFEAPIGIGTHTVCVIASNSAAGPDGNLRYGGPGASGNCAIVTHGSAAPFGWLDSAASTGSSLTVKGWAVDPDTPSAAVQVQLVVNGAIVASGSANAAKPGLGAAIATYAPGAGDNHGYSLTATLTPGTHTVCVVAENDSPGPTTTLRYGGAGCS